MPLVPVKRSIRDDDRLLGFVHFQADAEALLGARAKRYDVALPYKAYSISQAWDAASRISGFWTEWVKDRQGGDPKAPTPEIRQSKDDCYTLHQSFYLLSRDIPCGRSVREAADAPILFYPRTRRKKLYYQGKTPVWKTREFYPKSFATERYVSRKFHSLIQSGAATVETTGGGKFTISLTYWRLEQIQLPRDIPPSDADRDNFDLWGNWKVQESARTIGGVTLIDDVDEGSGRGMY